MAGTRRAAPATSARASGRQGLRVAVKIAVTVALLAFIARSVDLESAGRVLQRLAWPVIAGGFAVLVALSLLQALRWRAIVVALGQPLGWRQAWAIALIGVFFSQLLPTSIGGDVARVYKLHQAQAPLARAFNSVLLDRVVALIAVVLILAAGAPVLLAHFAPAAVASLLAIVLAGTAGGIALLAIASRLPAARALIGRTAGERVGKLLHAVADDAARVLFEPRTALVTLVLSFTIQVALSGVIWAIAVDAGARIGFLTCAVLVPLVILVSMLPVSIAGWGIRENAMVVAFGAAGVDGATSLATSVAFGLLIAATGVPGAIIWLRGRRHKTP